MFFGMNGPFDVATALSFYLENLTVRKFIGLLWPEQGRVRKQDIVYMTGKYN